MLSRVGLDRLSTRAPVLLILAANAPDIDIVSALFPDGSVSYLEHHRGATHSLLMAPALAALIAVVVGLIFRARGISWLRAWLVALVGVLSHLAMDWTNIYGIRLWWPFNRNWPRGDFTPVVDLWIWAVLLIMVTWPLLARLVSSEIGARSKAGRGIAWFALVFLAAWEFGRWVLHERAVETLASRIYEGRSPRSVVAMPSVFHPLAWRGLIQMNDGYLFYQMDLRNEFDPSSGQRYYQAEQTPYLETAQKTRAFAVFRDFAPYPLWQETKLPEPEGAVQVNGIDLRFALPGEGRFTVSAILESGRVVESWFQFTPRGELPRPK
jgi:inner membrane protein